MASKRRLRRKSCESKKRYDTHEDALKMMRGLNYLRAKNRMRNPGEKHIYKCNFCGGFHIGTVGAKLTSPIMRKGYSRT